MSKQELQAERDALWAELEKQGGRGVELAEAIDALDRKLGATYETFQVRIDLDEAVDLDLEGFLDELAERAGHPLLSDFTYKVVGHEGDTLILDVTGDTSLDDEYVAGGAS